MEELEASYQKSKASPSLPNLSTVDDEDEDDAMKYFQKLVDE